MVTTSELRPSKPTAAIWCLVAGGGTAGHIIPGLAVAQALVEMGHTPESIHFLGASRGAEGDMVPAAGFEVTLLPGRGLNGRKLNFANLKAAWGIVRAVISGIRFVGRIRPKVILALGGFAAVPGVVGGIVWRVPIIVTEQNAKASLANRLAGRFAKRCALPFEGTDLPNGVVTGNPIRHEIVEAAEVVDDPTQRRSLRSEFGVGDDDILVAVQSGSLGARSVNRAVIELAERWRSRSDVVIYHVIGRRDWQSEHARVPQLDETGLRYRQVEFEEQTPKLMAAADVFVGRAGASTVAELAVVGLPSVLVPLPIAPRDAQRANAMVLEAEAAAVILDDHNVSGESLESALNHFLLDENHQKAARVGARRVGHGDAAAQVARLVEEHARD